MKRFSLVLAALLLSVCAFAQEATGGVKAAVVNRAGRVPVANALVEVLSQGNQVASVKTDEQGFFLVENLLDGNYTLNVSAADFMPAVVNIKVEKGFIRDLVFVALTAAKPAVDVDDSSFAEFDMQDSGYSDSPTILFSNNDPYTSVASYGFSSIRFKNRGYNSEAQEVLLAGVKMNDAITGYSPFSLWSGLNEAMRSKETSEGMDAVDSYIGGYNGVTDIAAVPSKVRPGLRLSVLTNSALYRLRLMSTYATGEQDNGWSYAVNASVRAGGNDWVDGVYYRSLGLYAGAEKRIDSANRLALFAFATPGQRGAQNASTQEVYDLMGDNMYNSNWGYQNGKVRNARVRKTFEPIIGLKYTYTPSKQLEANGTLLFRTGRNGYTALDWYDAQDPRPDYYRNLPSYFKMADSDMDVNRNNLDKYEWAEYAWTQRGKEFMNYQHINWDRMYNVNYNNAEGRSKYAQEERHVDQNELNLAGNVKWLQSSNLTILGGAQAKFNRTRNYKKMADLLGGKFFVDVDQFAERDFVSSEASQQNDLDYYLAHGEARKIGLGDKYGYDYLANIIKSEIWGTGIYTLGGLTANVSAKIGVETFWRTGLVRKGLFAGLDDNGQEIKVGDRVLTTYDENGNVISSKGNSSRPAFLVGSVKAGASYAFQGGHRVYGNVGFFANAPTFNQSFVSARTRNTIIDGLTTIKTFSTDINYQYSANGYNARVTAYYTTIHDQTDVMSFYDDSQQSLTNFAMTGINQRHMGIEAGVKVPTPISGLTLAGVLSLGEYIYTSNPHMVQTVDNSSKVIRESDVAYWMKDPVYKMITNESGNLVSDEDANGNPIILGYNKHYVPSTPQLATELAINYNINYWFLELNGQYFAHSHLDMNPLYRTAFAVEGPDGIATPDEVMSLTRQEEFAPAFLLNLSIGKSWFVHGNQIGFSLNANNILNNRGVKTGGYEQTRLLKDTKGERYYTFDSKYFYMPGANYMLNVYFRF